MKDWLDDLLDEYPTNRSDNAIARLVRVFRDVDDETMQAAVDAYMMDGNEFFPKVASLAPYVQAAQEDDRGPVPYDQIRRVHYGRWQSVIGEHYSDEEILAWEQRRGTMPPDDELGTEYGSVSPPAVDEGALQAIQDAYTRSGVIEAEVV